MQTQPPILSAQGRTRPGRHHHHSQLPRALRAGADRCRPSRRLVVIFQRGAADGLNIVVPYREKNYYTMRPSIAIPQNQVIDLDGFFGLHPSLACLQAALRPGTSRHRARRRLARHVALALRRAGLHGVGHARREEHRGRLAEPRTAGGRPAPSPGSTPRFAHWLSAPTCRARSPAKFRPSRSAT